MPRFEYPRELREEARRLRKGGATHQSIATALGVSRETVRSWCSERARKKHNAAGQRWNTTTARGRVHASVQKTKTASRKHGGKHCETALDEILAYDDSACNICKTPVNPEGKRLFLDHDHATGVFRGWLCANCNSGLGHFRDSKALLAKAIDYLTGKAR